MFLIPSQKYIIIVTTKNVEFNLNENIKILYNNNNNNNNKYYIKAQYLKWYIEGQYNIIIKTIEDLDELIRENE